MGFSASHQTRTTSFHNPSNHLNPHQKMSNMEWQLY